MPSIPVSRLLFPIGLVALLAACNQDAAPEPTLPSDPAPAAAGPAEVADAVAEVDAQTGPLWLEPLAGCGIGQVSTLHWSKDLLAKGPVEIRFGESADAPLFGEVGSAGSKETGPWLKPGAVFVARAADGTEVARAEAMGPDCQD